ncbi:MAG TPA: ABC transporter permease [Bryobacteraceae bacterium]|nr:ABC transporter permease [Bryobacteraceae bacterium]
MLDTLWQDSRHAIRALRKDPGFAAVTALSLALGIGANTAIFSLIDAVMLKTLPVSHPEELLQVTTAGGGGGYFSNPVWEQIRDRQDAFSGIFAYCRWAFNLATGGEARNVNGEYVSGQLFETLGVSAALGRTFTPKDDRRGCAGAAVLTYGFWQREYAGRSDILGRTISIDHHPFEIVGVAERGFTGTEVGASLDLMVPLCAEKALHGDTTLLDADPSGRWLRILGRPKQGTSASQASARLQTLAPEVFRATVQSKWPAQDREKWLRLPLAAESAANGLSSLREDYRQTLFILMAIAGMVLLIGCANMSNLLLARGAVRQREIAIRMALGSGRGRLVRQMLTESLLLSFLGAGLGVLVAIWGTSLLVKFLNVSLDLTPDPRVLGFTAGVAILTGLLFGLAPAWRGSRADPMAAMKAGSRGSARGSGSSAGKMLVIGQLVLSMVLVAGAGLLLSTLWRLAWLDPGFEVDRVLLTSIDLRGNGYTPDRRNAVYSQILKSVRALPGVRAASLSDLTPMFPGRRIHDLVIEGNASPAREAARVFFNSVSDGYFATIGTPLVAGRDFNGHDTQGSPAVAIVNQTMVRQIFRGANPVGFRFRIRTGDTLGDSVEIVGVVKDAKYSDLRQEIPPTAYTSWSQTHFPFTNMEVRAVGRAPSAVIGEVKGAIASVDGSAPIEFTSLANQTARTLQREQLLATLAGFFGGLALLLAIIGLYGVMSYNVTRRRSEIGIRMALGAEKYQVLRMVMAEVAVLIGAGIAVGLGVTLAATRLLARFLYGVRPNDPLTLLLAAGVLAAAAGAAGYWPARRAARVDPMTSLREE